jgi:hypothetical protein
MIYVKMPDGAEFGVFANGAGGLTFVWQDSKIREALSVGKVLIKP